MKLLKLVENIITNVIGASTQDLLVRFNITVPIWHTIHSYKNKNRTDYNHSYDVDKTPITDQEIIELYDQILPTFKRYVSDNIIKENIPYIINIQSSTTKIASYLERPSYNKKTLNWFIRLITIRRNRLGPFPDQVVINEQHLSEQQLKTVLTSIQVPILVTIKFTKQFLNQHRAIQLQECYNFLDTNRNQIIDWIKRNNLTNEQKIEIPINQLVIQGYFGVINPFESEIKITSIK